MSYQIDGAVITAQRVTFAIVVVKSSVIQSSNEAQKL